MPPLTRPDLEKLPSYVPGRSIPGAIKLASNEVPYGPLPGVVEAVTHAAAQAHRYPDMAVVELREALAHRYGVAPERVATGCGSVALTEHLAKATCLPGDEIVYAWRSFEAYPIITAGAAATGVRVPNDAGHGHDLAAMAAAVTDRTRMILVCNPNNPTGTALRRAALDRFLDDLGPEVLVVIDEAYREFVTDELVPDGIELYRDRPNVCVLRTFSKAYGLAGLRVGFLIGHEPVAEAVRKTMLPFTVSSVAQAAAIASLDAEDQMMARVRELVTERRRVRDALISYGYAVPPTEANFVWLRLGARTPEFAQACASQGVAVRPFGTEGVRISVGETEGNDRMLGVARAFKAN